MLRIGIDTGGTYTDFYAVHRGRVWTWKVPSTPRQPGRALESGLQTLLARLDVPMRQVELVYGSTVATNALLERRGGRTGFVTSAGFEDLLEIGRQARASLYDLNVQKPQALVQPPHQCGAHECIDPGGRVLVPLEAAEAEAIARTLASRRIESVAVCLLFSYVNPSHERILERALRKHGMRVTSSHRLLPEYREYERAQTTVINAYLLPVVERSLRDLGSRVRVQRFSVLQSNGGRLSLRAAAQEPVRLLLSGPVGGVLGAWQAARRAGLRRAIAFDMGGTSTDVSLLDGGPPERLAGARVAGWPIGLPMLDIHTVGAGGGSIARRDLGGALRVGPESAGADPGPACLGGDAPTVTDAHVVLGRIRPSHYLGGRLQLDVARAQRAIARLADSLALDPRDAALGILRVANATMEKALRVVSLERGVDPRTCALISFGGAGGLHAAELVQALRLQGALVPAQASVLSACGMAHANIERDYGRTLLRRLPIPQLDALFEPLLDQARRDMRREGVTKPRFELRLEMRYVGQSYELQVPHGKDFERRFHRLHAQRFGFSVEDEALEVVALRVRALGHVPAPPLAQRSRSREAAVERREKLWFAVEGGPASCRSTRLLSHERLALHERVRGPALILRDDTTVLVPADFTCQVRTGGALWLHPSRRPRQAHG